MRIAVNSIRFLVGILFILSGLVKANDPLGLSYKMQEFFEVWNASLNGQTLLTSVFSYFHHHSLALAVFMIALEIVAGLALLVGWQKKLVLNTLLVLITFFTFLTAYALWSGKFKNCGCFGDCLPISPLTSFVKDVLLLVMIAFLRLQHRFIEPITRRAGSLIVAGSLVATLLLQWYTLNYLPLADCLPFKKGNSIAEQMKIPAYAIQDSFAMKFIYEREGKRFEFAPEELPADLGNYKFIDRIQKLIRKGNAEPPIKGFTLTGKSGADSTTAILNTPKALLVIGEDFSESDWVASFKLLQARALQQGIPIYIVTPGIGAADRLLTENGIANVPVFSCDNTAVRTAARTNPTLYLLERGVVMKKATYRRMDSFRDEL